MFFHRNTPPLIEVSLAEKSAEIVVIESIRTVVLHVAIASNPAAPVDVENVYANFRQHLNKRGYHLEIITEWR